MLWDLAFVNAMIGCFVGTDPLWLHVCILPPRQHSRARLRHRCSSHIQRVHSGYVIRSFWNIGQRLIVIAVDTQLIMRHYHVEEEIAAAISLYLDIINLFLAILRILNSQQNN